MPTVPNRVKLPTEKDCMWKPVVGLIVNVALPPMANTCWPETVIARLASAIASVSVPSGARVIPRVPLRSTTPATLTSAPATVSSNVFGLTPSSVEAVVLIWKLTLPDTFSPSSPTSWRVPLAVSAYWPAVGLAPGASMNDRVAPLTSTPIAFALMLPSLFSYGPLPTNSDSPVPLKLPAVSVKLPSISTRLSRLMFTSWAMSAMYGDASIGTLTVTGVPLTVTVWSMAAPVVLISRPALALSESPLPPAEIVPSRTPAKPLPVMISAPRAFEMEPNEDEPL